MKHPANETNLDKFLHGFLPAITALVLVAVSIVADLSAPGKHWTQRAGAVMTILGAYVAYHDAMRSFKYINGTMYMNFELPYRRIAIILVVFGTAIWGYGDLAL